MVFEGTSIVIGRGYSSVRSITANGWNETTATRRINQWERPGHDFFGRPDLRPGEVRHHHGMGSNTLNTWGILNGADRLMASRHGGGVGQRDPYWDKFNAVHRPERGPFAAYNRWFNQIFRV